MSRRPDNVKKIQSRININIGLIVLIVILIYILITFFIYLTQKRTKVYQVSMGSISQDSVYTGFAIRDEMIVKAPYSGHVNYFSRKGERAGMDSVLFTIDETGSISEQINLITGSVQAKVDVEKLKTSLSDFTLVYSDDTFFEIYADKEKLYDVMYSFIYDITLDQIDSTLTADNTFFHKINPVRSGIISYTVDGYENIKENEITPSLFNMTDYSISSLQTSVITTNDDAYRLIYDDYWSIYFLLDDDKINSFKDLKTIGTEFISTGISLTLPCEIINIGENSYLKLSLNSYAINYIDDRFINVKFTESSVVGLKIPVSSVLKRNFYTIPKEYITGGDTFMLESYDSNGNVTFTAVKPTIYYEDESFYYISTKELEAGNLIRKKDSDETFAVGTIGELTGVYCVDRGYAVFRKVDIIDEGNGYYIVTRNNKYGISNYDRIALDYTTVSENQLIN